MMKKYSILFILSIVIFIISGCEKEADIKIPDGPHKLVITSFISPQDTLIRVRVTKTVSVFRTYSVHQHGFAPLHNAIVNLSDGTISVTLNFDPDRGDYFIDAKQFPIRNNATYRLDVSTLDGLKARGTCTVPAINESLSIVIDTINKRAPYDSEQRDHLQIKMDWKDDSPTTDYYKIGAVLEGKTPINPSYPDSPRDFYTHFYFEEGHSLLKETESKNRSFSKKGDTPMYYLGHGPTPIEDPTIHVFLTTVDEAYYKYEQWLSTNTDDPFSEPTLVYTNIEGGLGVFSAFNKTTITKKL